MAMVHNTGDGGHGKGSDAMEGTSSRKFDDEPNSGCRNMVAALHI